MWNEGGQSRRERYQWTKNAQQMEEKEIAAHEKKTSSNVDREQMPGTGTLRCQPNQKRKFTRVKKGDDSGERSGQLEIDTDVQKCLSMGDRWGSIFCSSISAQKHPN